MQTNMVSDQLTDEDLVEYVRREDDGVSALQILEFFVKDRRISEREVQRSLQRALNSNKLVLGPKLRLFVNRTARTAA